MTDKISLTDLANLQNETTACTAINANNATLIAAINNTLSRDGDVPNQLSASLDMNSNHIINLPAPGSNSEPVRQADLNAVQTTLQGEITSLTSTVTSNYNTLHTQIVDNDNALSTLIADNFTTLQNEIDDIVPGPVTYVSIGVEGVDATVYGVVADGSHDDTAALRTAYANSYGKRLFLPHGVIRVTSDPTHPALTIDPSQTVIIQGMGSVIGNGETGTLIYNPGTGVGIAALSSGLDNTVVDRQVQFRDFALRGASTSLDGFRVTHMSRIQFYNVASTANGGCGIFLGYSFGASIRDCFINANKLDGIRIDGIGNIISIIGTSCSGNGGTPGSGRSNLAIVRDIYDGDSYAITVIGGDYSGYLLTDFGITAGGYQALTIQGTAIEGCNDAAFYSANNGNGLTFTGNYVVDSLVDIEGIKNSYIGPNMFISTTGAAKLKIITSNANDNVGVTGQVYLGGATEELDGPGIYKIGRAP